MCTNCTKLYIRTMLLTYANTPALFTGGVIRTTSTVPTPTSTSTISQLPLPTLNNITPPRLANVIVHPLQVYHPVVLSIWCAKSSGYYCLPDVQAFLHDMTQPGAAGTWFNATWSARMVQDACRSHCIQRFLTMAAGHAEQGYSASQLDGAGTEELELLNDLAPYLATRTTTTRTTVTSPTPATTTKVGISYLETPPTRTSDVATYLRKLSSSLQQLCNKNDIGVSCYSYLAHYRNNVTCSQIYNPNAYLGKCDDDCETELRGLALGNGTTLPTAVQICDPSLSNLLQCTTLRDAVHQWGYRCCMSTMSALQNIIPADFRTFAVRRCGVDVLPDCRGGILYFHGTM